MSQTIRNGQTIRVNIETGKKLAAVAVSGTYSVTVLAGTGAGASLATNATGGTYGPYAYGLVVQIVASAQAEIDFDVGVTTVIDSDTVALIATDPLTGQLAITVPDGSTRSLPSVSNMQSSTPISLTGTTSQKTLIVARIPAEKLSPGCRISAEFEFSRNRTGAGSVSYGIYLNDYFCTSVGQGEQIISTTSMTTASQDVRREVADILIGADVRYQKYLQNNATAGALGNLNKYVDCNYNGNKGLAIVVAASLANAADVFTIESYKIEVTK
jgi:hypothetical protein